jgi:glc operon protein GlcG
MSARQPVLGHAEAASAVDAIRRELDKIGKSAVIAVVDAHGELLAFLRMDGAQVGSIGLSLNKAYTAARLRRTSRALGERLAKGIDLAYYGDPRYTGFGGGVPVIVDGATIGAVGVSALSDEEDEALANIGVAILADVARR